MANGQTWKNILQGIGSLPIGDIINKPKTVFLPNPNVPTWTPPKASPPNSHNPTSKQDEDMQKYLIIGAVVIGAYLILKK